VRIVEYADTPGALRKQPVFTGEDHPGGTGLDVILPGGSPRGFTPGFPL